MDITRIYNELTEIREELRLANKIKLMEIMLDANRDLGNTIEDCDGMIELIKNAGKACGVDVRFDD